MSNLPIVHTEEDNIIEAARENAGFGPILTYVKGEYFLEKKMVDLGTQFKVYTKAWVQVWINFGPPVQQFIYQIAKGQKPPEREKLGDLDKTKWATGLNNDPKDPWVKQFLLPFEFVDTGDRVTFRTSSGGGKRTVADLCSLCAFRSKRGDPSIPIIKLASTTFSGRQGVGKVQKPQFDIVGWDEDDGVYRAIDPEIIDGDGRAAAQVPIDDEIPFAPEWR